MARLKVANLLESLIDDPNKVTNLEKSILNSAIKLSNSKNAPKTIVSKLNKQNNIDFEKIDFGRTRIKKSFENKYFCNIYKAQARKVIYNLRNVPGLQEKINTGEIECTELPFLKPEEIHPERWHDLFEKRSKKERANLDLENVDNMASGLFTCNKCKSDKTQFYSLQTRSADEPMTHYVTCLNCGKKWKEN